MNLQPALPSSLKSNKNQLEFEVLLDESFSALHADSDISPKNNKNVLSIINDFEDGVWRYKKFNQFVWNNIAETALSHRERQSLIGKGQSQLICAAKNLRLTDKDTVGKASELAEIVLYALMKLHFNALPVVPKIFYKQNAQDNAKGADSVHIVLEKNDTFSIWFGEAKFFNSIEDSRFTEIIKSVAKSLETKKLKKENSIVTGVSDLDELVNSDKVRTDIKTLLAEASSIDNLKPKLNVPILLLHECEKTKQQTILSESYKKELIELHKQKAATYFKKQIDACKEVHDYSSIKFHIILFPVPSKDEVVKRFLDNVEFYKSQDDS